MKLTCILLLTACLQVTAKSYSQHVTLRANNAPLEQVFKEIKKQTGYVFFYDAQILAVTKPVSIDVRNADIDFTLKEILKGQALDYSIENKTITILRKLPEEKKNITAIGNVAMPATIDVHGVVKDETGKPAAGVAVKVKGTNKGTITNDNGEFTLTGVDENATLVFSAVNLQTFELKVSGKTEFAVSLKTKTKELGEVAVQVNTGYQQISKERFVGSYSQLDSADFHRRAGMSIIDRLDGTVPGVLFNNKKDVNFPIQIRGISTLGNYGISTSPLIVVDNFPMPETFSLSNINANDVESVTVLKDAAAASIWGSRAGNGVIVITTKKGKYNQQFHLTVSSNTTITEKSDLFYYPTITPSDFIDIETSLFNKGFYNSLINNTSNRPVISPVVEILARRKMNLLSASDSASQIDALRHNDTRDDLNKYLYRLAIQQQHYLSFSGGNNVLAYQLSVGYNHSLNNLQGSKGADQYTINSNTSFRPVKNLEIQTGINYTLGVDKSSPSPNLPSYPYVKLAAADGTPLAIPYQYRQGYIDTAGAGILQDWHYVPLNEVRLADNKVTQRFIRLNTSIAYQFTNWLRASINYQYQNVAVNTLNYQSIKTWFTRDFINRYTNPNATSNDLRYPLPVGGILNLSNSQAQLYNVRGNININKRFGEHQLSAMLSGEISDSKGGDLSAQRLYGYNNQTGSYTALVNYFTYYPLYYAAAYPGQTATIPSIAGYSQSAINRFVSLLGNVAYTYKNRYNFYASARRDGANVFGVNTNNKWKPLWSVGAGWELSKESFYHVSWLPYLKLRGSYGYTGNANNTLSGRLTLNNSSSVDPITLLPYSTPNIPPNPDLKWEETRIVNAGLDFQLWKNRVGGSLETFFKQSSNVIGDALLPPSSGVTSATINYANLKSTGFEFSINSVNTKGAVSWTTNAGWSYAKTIIKDVLNLISYKTSVFNSYALNAAPGRIAYGISSYRWAGLDPATGDPQGYYKGQVSKDYTSILNDSIQNQVFHGSALPLHSIFIKNNISWKGFTVSLNITGRFDYYFRESALNLNYSDQAGGTNYLADYYHRWQKSGDEVFTSVPSMSYPSPANAADRNTFYQFAAIHVKRGDNIRLQDIRLSYLWDNKNNKRIPVQSVQFFFYPNNLNWILWRAESSPYDPDYSGGGLNGGISIPTPKTWTGGITINF
ncbi:MAG: SusC/RagA family TonB-linked outer membrane protein [Sphingobacteriia bacterium]|nr:SusC/RagA family TonB-linked outer membrane protein [Sphingobacteriia bacterium]